MMDGPTDRAPHFATDETQGKLQEKMQQLRLQDKERELMGKAQLMGLPYMNLQGFPISADSIAIIPEEVARELRIVSFWSAINDLRIGAVDPESASVKEYLQGLARAHYTEPKLHFISEKSFQAALGAYRSVPKVKKASRGVEVSEAELNRFSESISSLADIGEAFQHVSTTEGVSAMIAGALKTRASDMHIEAEQEGVVLRYRIDGVLYPVATLPKVLWTKMVPRLKLLSGLKINVSDRPQDGRFTIHLTNDQIDVRVSTLPTNYGESIVMRILRASSTGVNFDSLGITGTARDRVLEQMARPQGMIITTGPTGSGKTTTLYAMLNRLNDKETKIITLEDPIEYRLEGVNQSQVDPSAGYTFSSGLRSILRQDPDIILVGEIRDLETADIAANAALTGHLVLTTLHTNNAAGAIPRFLGMGIQPFLLPPALSAVMAQRLVRRVCSQCTTTDALDEKTMARVQQILNTLPLKEKEALPKTLVFHKGAGCDSCQGIGFKGQVGIYEVFTMTKEIEDVILAQAVSERKIEELAEAAGMVTMAQDGLLKALQGITSVSEVFRVTSESTS